MKNPVVKEVENSARKSMKQKQNKAMHSMFGNSTSMKQLKISAINKGNSKLKNVGQELLNNISKSKSDIVILSEAITTWLILSQKIVPPVL